jgi:xanthine dehydrogenase YagT iron-sulfur-binding subunit
MQEHEQQRHGPGGFNRRDFLKGSSAAVAATAIATAEQEALAQKKGKAAVQGPGKVDVTLTVNGKQHKLSVEPRTTLLDALRDQLNLTGCKDDFDATSCSGSDTVIIDGKAVYASTRLAIEVQGQKIQTVESLRNGDQLDEVITGFVQNDAMQCGFCTPGFVMATRAFLNKKPKATLEEIQDGLGGNICRCGTYKGITACALQIAKGGA